MQWLSTTLFAPDPELAKKSHGSAKKHQHCYNFMKQCIRRVEQESGAVEAITAQFQSAAFQCPDSKQKRSLCLEYELSKPLSRGRGRGWN
jgi:hypothetical protein